MRQPSESYAQTAPNTKDSPASRLSKALKKITSPRDRAIISLLLETGCSIAELIELKPADFEFATNSALIGQGKKRRTVPFSKETGETLKKLFRKEHEYAFSSRQSSRLTRQTVAALVRKHTKNLLGGELGPHDLKRMAVEKEFEKTQSIEHTKESTGLKSIRSREVLTKSQLESIRQQIKDEQHKIMFDILAQTGCKLNELVSIKIADVDSAKHIITLNKRTSKISKELSLGIKRLAEEKRLSQKDFLFSTRQSPQVSDKRVFQLVKGYARQAGFASVSPQTIRNSVVAEAMLEGKTASEIETMTGIRNLGPSHFGLQKPSLQMRKDEQHEQDKE